MMTSSAMEMIAVASSNSSTKLMPAPTVMKNSPSSSPLKGSMSVSSSWRNSEVARTTPARKAPSAGEIPTRVIRNEIPTTISRADAVYISRRREAWMKRKSGRVRKTPARMIEPMAAMVTRVTPQPGSPSTSESEWCPSPWAASAMRCIEPSAASIGGKDIARSGRKARIGITAMSCARSTEKMLRPPSVCIRPFSDRVWSTIAVELSDSVRPMARATPQS